MTSPFFPRRSAAAALLLTAGIITVGCVADGGGSAPTATTVTVASPVPTTVTVENTTAPAGLMPLGDASKEEKTRRPEAPSELTLENVRVGDHRTFERVVFDLKGEGDPGWFITYTDAPRAQGSGRPVKVTGDSFLVINIDGVAYAHTVDETARDFSTTELPNSIITEIVDTGTFEGRRSFFAGLKGDENPFSVDILHNPTRLVIDILKR